MGKPRARRKSFSQTPSQPGKLGDTRQILQPSRPGRIVAPDAEDANGSTTARMAWDGFVTPTAGEIDDDGKSECRVASCGANRWQSSHFIKGRPGCTLHGHFIVLTFMKQRKIASTSNVRFASISFLVQAT